MLAEITTASSLEGRKYPHLFPLLVPVACLLTMCTIGVAPVASKYLAVRLGIDPFGWFGSVHTISAAKVAFFRNIGIGLSLIGVASCMWGMLRGARMTSVLGLVVSATILTPAMMLQSALHPTFNELIDRFVWKEMSIGLDLTAWEPGMSLRKSLTKYSDVPKAARSAYTPAIDRALQGLGSDSTLRRAAFFTVIASHWWGPGNREDRTRAGCVRQSERTQHQAIGEYQVTFALYRDSDVGCCDDFSHLLKLLLDADGIPNRVVIAAGHAFNEAMINGRGYLLDGMNAMIVDSSWESINRGIARGTVNLFPIPAADPASPLFRSAASAERFRLISIMLNGGFTTRYVDTLPTFFTTVESYR